MAPKGMQKNAAVLATLKPRLSRRYNGVIKLRVFKALRRPWRVVFRRPASAAGAAAGCIRELRAPLARAAAHRTTISQPSPGHPTNTYHRADSAHGAVC